MGKPGSPKIERLPNFSSEEYSASEMRNMVGTLERFIDRVANFTQFPNNNIWVTRSTATNDTFTDDDAILDVDDSGGVRTIGTPAAADVPGRIYVLQKASASNSTVLDPNGSETIDGAGTLTLSTQYNSVMFYSNGTAWRTIAKNF